MQSTDISVNIKKFSLLLDSVVPNKISQHIYCVNYLQHLIGNKAYYLNIYADLLNRSFKKTAKNIDEISVLDFGCGNGLLGLFLKFCGCKHITLMDSDPLFLSAAKTLGRFLKIEIDAFYCGDENELQNLVAPDLIIGTDVIEHVYDIDVLFQKMHQINPKIVSAFTTASNPENKRNVKKLMALQMKDELEGGVESKGIAGHQPHLSFLQMRKNIIQNFQLKLSDDEIHTLAVATRGKKEKDIRKTVDLYIQNNIFPTALDHPTNTCDPYTGSWTENILTIPVYKKVYNKNGFHLDLCAGFYNQYHKGMKAYMAKCMNVLIRFSGIRYAPYIILIGTPENI